MTVSEQIIQVINALCEKFGIAINWTGENVIPYVEVLCKKLVAYEIVSSIINLIIWVAIIIGGIIITKKSIPAFKNGLEKDRKNYTCGWEIGTVFGIVGLAIIAFVALIVIPGEIEDIIKCLIFPEMYIYEYISALIQ